MEGWKEIEIDGKKVRTCGKCKWYDYKLVKSGNNPIYANICSHASVGLSGLYMGNLNRGIDGYVKPTDLCPYTEGIERELKINRIIDENK